jgi:co-chaperonin GroES (HSP10)
MKAKSKASPAMINKTGVYPTEFNVLVEPKAVAKMTAGGIHLPEVAHDKEQAAAVEGVIVDVAPLAFSYADWPDELRPKAGDRVAYAKYAGMTIKRGGVEYRLMKDKDIAAVLEG